MENKDQLIKQAAELFLINAPTIVCFGISGVVIIAGLMWALRRYLKEQRALEERRNTRAAASGPHIDAWQSAAERYEDPEAAEPGSPFTNGDEDENDETWGTGEDEGLDDQDEIDDDDDKPWL